MSSVTMCDFCLATTRTGTDFKKVRLPELAVPEVLSDVGTGTERVFDACTACLADLATAFGEFLSRRIGSLGAEGAG